MAERYTNTAIFGVMCFICGLGLSEIASNSHIKATNAELASSLERERLSNLLNVKYEFTFQKLSTALTTRCNTKGQ